PLPRHCPRARESLLGGRRGRQSQTEESHQTRTPQTHRRPHLPSGEGGVAEFTGGAAGACGEETNERTKHKRERRISCPSQTSALTEIHLCQTHQNLRM